MAILALQTFAVDILCNWDLEVWLSSLIHSNLLRTGANRGLLVFRYDTNQSKVAEVLPSAMHYFHLQKIETLAIRRLKRERAIFLYSGWVSSPWAFMRMSRTKTITNRRSLEKSKKWHWKKGRKRCSGSFLSYQNFTQILLKLGQEANFVTLKLIPCYVASSASILWTTSRYPYPTPTVHFGACDEYVSIMWWDTSASSAKRGQWPSTLPGPREVMAVGSSQSQMNYSGGPDPPHGLQKRRKLWTENF